MSENLNKWSLGAFYTVETPYEKVIQECLLKNSCLINGIQGIITKDGKNISPIHIIKTRNFGAWSRNVAEKPKVILDLLNKMDKNECLVFVDADATIEKYPLLFDEIPLEYEIAFHRLSWKEWYGYKDDSTTELLSGTMFFRNTDKIKKLCEEWYAKSVLTNEWEQKVLAKILPNYDIKCFELPLAYCYMKSRPGDKPPLVQLEPYIIHHQASRLYKRIMK